MPVAPAKVPPAAPGPPTVDLTDDSVRMLYHLRYVALTPRSCLLTIDRNGSPSFMFVLWLNGKLIKWAMGDAMDKWTIQL